MFVALHEIWRISLENNNILPYNYLKNHDRQRMYRIVIVITPRPLSGSGILRCVYSHVLLFVTQAFAPRP